MLYEIIQDVILPKVQALNSIERLAGLVKVVNRQFQNADGQLIRQSFPIAAHVSHRDCFSSGMYGSLCPDNSRVSVAFFREKSASYQQGQGRQQNILYRFQFSAWFNLQLLGISEPNVPFNLVWDIIRTVTGVHNHSAGPSAKVTCVSINQHSPQAVFGEYTFGQDDSLFMYPYAFVGIDFDANVSFDPSCLTLFTPGTPINCQIV